MGALFTLDSTVIAELLKAEREQPDRGHREHAGLGAPDSNEGNFLELLKLLAHYDSIIEQHMNNLVSRVTYLSHQFQNELIAALSKETLSTIIDEIKYVTKTGSSIERFIKFEELPDGSVHQIEDSRPRFKADIYFYILDVFVGQFESRFSDLKKMANLCLCMDEARLSNLTLLFVEPDIHIDKDKVVGRFATMKERRMKI
ncbi:unnamed protein product [Leuciscus chuanchicus]